MAETAQALTADRLDYITKQLAAVKTDGLLCIEADDLASLLAAAEQHAEMLAVLRSVEWNGFDVICDDVCPACAKCKREGHTPDCTLSAAIKKAGG